MADLPPDVPDAAEVPPLIRRLAGMAAVRDIPASCGIVRWHCFGAGEPLVLVHGGHGSWLHWVHNIEALSRCHTVLVPDLPGYGASGAPPRKDLAGLVEAFVEALDVIVGKEASIDMVGFSFGALVAAYAAAQRGNVENLALLGTAGHGLPRLPTAELLGWKTAGGAELERIMRHNLAAQMIHRQDRIDALAVWVHGMACRAARFHSRPYSRSDVLPELLTRISARLLLIWGRHDVTGNPADVVRLLAAQRPDCETGIVEDAGHWVQFEAAETVNRLLADWLVRGRAAVKIPRESFYDSAGTP